MKIVSWEFVEFVPTRNCRSSSTSRVIFWTLIVLIAWMISNNLAHLSIWTKNIVSYRNFRFCVDTAKKKTGDSHFFQKNSCFSQFIVNTCTVLVLSSGICESTPGATTESVSTFDCDCISYHLLPSVTFDSVASCIFQPCSWLRALPLFLLHKYQSYYWVVTLDCACFLWRLVDLIYCIVFLVFTPVASATFLVFRVFCRFSMALACIYVSLLIRFQSNVLRLDISGWRGIWSSSASDKVYHRMQYHRGTFRLNQQGGTCTPT